MSPAPLRIGCLYTTPRAPTARPRSDCIGDLIAQQALVGMKGDELRVNHREAMVASRPQALHEEDILLIIRLATAGPAQELHLLLQFTVTQRACRMHAVHRLLAFQVALDMQRVAQEYVTDQDLACPLA